VVFEAGVARSYGALRPDSVYEIDGFAFRTLAERGELLTSFATVNDVHFGETSCGVIEGSDVGPVFEVGPGEAPFPEVMNRAAVAEIAAANPAAVIVKGDLTSTGSQGEYDAFRAAYEPSFGERLTVVRGNHESYNYAPFAAIGFQEVWLEGVVLAVIDTSLDGMVHGAVSKEQLEQLDELAARADRPVLVFGHHHLGDRASAERADHEFGIDVDSSEALVEVFSRRARLRGYFAGHTHRNRVRRFEATGEVPWVEVACVKDYPGMWAEYFVHEGSILQVARRINEPAALEWSEKTRHMYHGLYRDYAFAQLSDRCFSIET